MCDPPHRGTLRRTVGVSAEVGRSCGPDLPFRARHAALAVVDVPGARGQVRAGRRFVVRVESHRRLSGSSGDACLGGMHVTYLVITILAAVANGYAASLNFVGAESVKVVADRVQVSRRWMVPLGALLASGAVGLLAGLRRAGARDGCSDRPRPVLHLRRDRPPTRPRPPDRRRRVLPASRGDGPNHQRRLPQPLVRRNLIAGAGS